MDSTMSTYEQLAHAGNAAIEATRLLPIIERCDLSHDEIITQREKAATYAIFGDHDTTPEFSGDDIESIAAYIDHVGAHWRIFAPWTHKVVDIVVSYAIPDKYNFSMTYSIRLDLDQVTRENITTWLFRLCESLRKKGVPRAKEKIKEFGLLLDARSITATGNGEEE